MDARSFRLGILEQFLDRFLDLRDFRPHDADLARHGPRVHQPGRGFPGYDVERLANLLAAERAVGVNTAPTPAVARRGEPAGVEVPPDEAEHGVPYLEGHVSDTLNLSDLLSHSLSVP